MLSLYESTKILKNELINTIASIDSPTFYSNITFSNRPFKEKEYFLKNIILNEEYETSIFIKIKSTIDEDKQYYYSHVFNLSPKNKEKGKDSNNLLIYLIIGLISLIVISFIALLIKYRIIMKKNKNLEEQMINLSLSEKNEDNEENKDDKVFLI